MVAEIIHAIREALHPTVAIAGITHASLSPSVQATVNPGAAGATGRADTVVHYRGVGATLMGIDNVYALQAKVTAGGVTLDRVVYARVVPDCVVSIDPGETANPGIADAVVVHRDLAIELFSTHPTELLALIGAAAATVTLAIHGLAGAVHSIAITNVYFDEILAPIQVPAADVGGRISANGVRGRVHFGAAEVWADVITADPTNFTAALAKIGAVAANLVLGTEGLAGANEKLTIKNVYFCGVAGALEIPAFDVGGQLPPFGITGLALWGATDTFALMLVGAADP